MTTEIETCPRRKAREKVTFVLAWFAYYQLFRTNEKKKKKKGKIGGKFALTLDQIRLLAIDDYRTMDIPFHARKYHFE